MSDLQSQILRPFHTSSLEKLWSHVLKNGDKLLQQACGGSWSPTGANYSDRHHDGRASVELRQFEQRGKVWPGFSFRV